MADGDKVSTLCVLLFSCCTVLPCTVLQGVGLLTPFWIVDDNCDTVGLFYNCCAINGTTGTNGTVIKYISVLLGLEATAFASFLVSTVCFFNMMCGPDSSSDNVCLEISVCLFNFLYVLAGMFSLTGCILIGVNNRTTSFGVSYYLCMVAGGYALAQVTISSSVSWFHRSKSDNKPDTCLTDVGLEKLIRARPDRHWWRHSSYNIRNR